MMNDDTPAPSLSSPGLSNDTPPKIFALVIGINRYVSPQFDDLTAAAGDADKFEAFLRNKLDVPQNNIINLRDERATRAAIIEGFVTLQDDPNIVKDQAAIIIYFAGHGACVDKPIEWVDWVTASGGIEVMCPSDMGNQTEGGEEVSGIPDRTISTLLNQLSELKGNNITLILDCCSSGGLTRSAQQLEVQVGDPISDGYIARQVQKAPRISSHCDEHIISKGLTRGARVAVGYSGKHHASHVLLAACGREQVAYEDPRTNSGLFTMSLLRTLSAPDVNDLTYTSLMHRLAMPSWQTPHCEGRHVSRRLFSSHVSGADGSLILGQLVKTQDGVVSYFLHAGAAQGITDASIFGIHASNLIPDSKHPNPTLGIMVASNIKAFTSRLTIPNKAPEFKIPRLFYCKLIKPGTKGFKLYCDDKRWLESVFPPKVCHELSITLAASESEASLCFSIVNDEVRFMRNDPMLKPWLGPTFPHVVGSTETYVLREVVRRMVHFRHQLLRTAPTDSFKSVSMELRELDSKYSATYEEILIPSGPNLIEKEPATIVVNENARLGMVIHNGADIPLYPYLFYFDPSDLAIIEWYKPPFGAGQGRLTSEVDAPLPAGGSLAIGYGDGGASPWQFLLRDGEDMDVGFFKLFLTTSPVDFSSIPQESPFEENTSTARLSRSVQHSDAWGTLLSTVVQVRPRKQLPLSVEL